MVCVKNKFVVCVIRREEKEMAFFEKLGKTVSEASQKTIAKTKELADTSKLHSMISEEEKRSR